MSWADRWWERSEIESGSWRWGILFDAIEEWRDCCDLEKGLSASGVGAPPSWGRYDATETALLEGRDLEEEEDVRSAVFLRFWISPKGSGSTCCDDGGRPSDCGREAWKIDKQRKRKREEERIRYFHHFHRKMREDKGWTDSKSMINSSWSTYSLEAILGG
jgi:hypothetical protein